jgi:ketosteroid isomerase-like protein
MKSVREIMRWMGPALAGGLACLTATAVMSGEREAKGPTAEGALAAEQAVTQATLANDAAAVGRWLADDWVVISARGDMADRAGYLGVIQSGDFSHKIMELSEPRVRVYGNAALVTTKLRNAGRFNGKDFDVMERQTDVLMWRDGAWKSVLLHESFLDR